MRYERVVIIKNMFHPKDFEEDPLVLNEIREDLRSECEKFGQVKKLLIFDQHPDGVASVAFKVAEEGDLCIQALNGRWFGGRQLVVEPWDGVTDYQIEETSREREERLKGWENFLSGSEEKKSESDVIPSNNKQSVENKDNGSTSEFNKENNVHQAENVQTDLPQDDAQSTDSDIGSSDEESEENKGQ